MSGITSKLYDLYIRLLVWLGAAPPPGYEHLLQDVPAASPQPPVKPPAVEKAPSPPVTEPPESGGEPEEEAGEPDLFWLERESAAIAEPPQEEVVLPALEAEPAPEPQPDPTTAFRYQIQRGDTLSGIARRFGLTLTELLAANDIPDPNVIFPGQKLIIPGYMSPPSEPQPEPPAPPADVVMHTVVAGETLSSIAKHYGVTIRQLVETNNIQDPNLIRAGQTLRIPQAAPPLQPTPPPPPGTIDPQFPPLGPLEAVRALYVSYFAIGHPGFREHMFNLLDSTEFNAVVIDAKGDHGYLSYPTNNATAHEIGAARPTAKDFDQVMAQLKARKIYTIARIVTFKDSPLARSFPEYAVRAASGEIWQDREELHWADPFLKPVWDYNLQLAIEAAQKGFDEIQFDYVRFPTPSQMGAPEFSQEVTKETRIAAITSFLSMARGQLQPFGVKIAADTFGYTCWRKDDTQIGQDIDRMGQYLDVLCPMLYPSTFGSGIPGYKFAIAHPYEIVYESARRAVERMAPLGCEVRPWIQDFPDYRFDKRVYGKAEIQAQIKGCFDSGGSGFMVWDPRVKYTEGAYAPIMAASTATAG